MKLRALTALLVSLVLATASFAQPKAPTDQQKATALAKPAVVFILSTFQAQVSHAGLLYGPYKVQGLGSGFIINADGFIVTNAHVVEATSQTRQMLLQSFYQQQIELAEKEAGETFNELQKQEVIALINQAGVPILMTPEGEAVLKNEDVPRKVNVVVKGGLRQMQSFNQALPAEVRALSTYSEKDIAILKVSGNNYPSVQLGNSDAVQLQDRVTVLGYPANVTQFAADMGLEGDSIMEPTITEGTISSRKQWSDGSPILGTDASAHKGNSGGPAINPQGEVIGVLSMGASSFKGDTTETTNFLRPINVALDFIRASGVIAKTSLTDTRYADALAHFWAAGDLVRDNKARAARREYEAAQEDLRGVLNLYPQHPDAGRYLQQAEELLSELPTPSAWRSAAGYGLAGAALLGLGLLAVPSIKKRSGNGGERRGAAASVWNLVAESGPLSGNQFGIADSLTIGRDPACSVVYAGDTVSRRHAQIQRQADGLTITNLSTTNQTFVNDRPVGQSSLSAGDRVRIGAVTFRVTTA